MNTITRDKDEYCGVNEEMFPYIEKCYRKNDSLLNTLYERVCPYCDISSCLPYGSSLKVVTIFVCFKLDYGKKVTD